jgi:hypothetical protein
MGVMLHVKKLLINRKFKVACFAEFISLRLSRQNGLPKAI